MRFFSFSGLAVGAAEARQLLEEVLLDFFFMPPSLSLSLALLLLSLLPVVAPIS